MFDDPEKRLIVQRINLVDAIYSRCTALAADARILRLASLASRIVASGHIKHDEDGTRVRVAVPAVIEFGENRRAALNRGNKRWLVSKRGQYTSPYVSDKEQEPRLLLRERQKSRFMAGVEKANKYADEFGHDFIYEPASLNEVEQQLERGRTTKRTHPGAFHRGKVIDALTMLRNSYPVEYDAALLEDQVTERKRVNKKVKAAKVRTPMPSPTTPPQSSPPKRLSIHSNASDASFASFVSADTFSVGARRVRRKASKVASAVRKVASKVPGLRCLKRTKDLPQGFAFAKSGDDLSTNSQTERHVNASHEKLDEASQWMGGLEAEAESTQEAPSVAELAARSILHGHDALPYPRRGFTIDAGVVLPVKPTPAPVLLVDPGSDHDLSIQF
ncbi:hypothetical protein G647_05696 [Cladophialophora carrionii CBS 160.54]|uniref:Uncharacterized protein n=1 Tax=Cladophialophora carrionii CBS 160.54 TaxID=1279043 RepID=V9DAH4_9EURO|nr:uncharacterized protein G647_05696 [Cladophialophora carrionii CBS 160.54]ETI23889.1 hypothetical protein G647_05696 [Cladophialophora carrionii CBS 160.54]